jgi:hypothetical protein
MTRSVRVRGGFMEQLELCHKAFAVLKSRLWLENDLGIALDTLVEFLIGSRCVIEWHLI